MLADDPIEVLRPDLPRGRFRSVLFDFDGTLSLIREGWPQVMIPMMVQALRATGTAETEAQLTAAVEDFVMRLNGRQTIYQMIQLADEVRRRGIDSWKRDRLVRAGADVVIPEYRRAGRLLAYLFAE